MDSFIKNTIRSIGFVAGLIWLFMLLSQIFIPKNNDKDLGMKDSSAISILAEPKNTIDVLILGDSESYCSVIPLQIWEQYGITSYCCGTPAQQLFYSEEFLNNAFENQSPKVVILETNAIYRDIHYIDMLVHKVSLVFPVFTYHNRWKSLKSDDFKAPTDYKHVNNNKGYIFSNTVMPANEENYMNRTEECASISSRNRAYVERMKTYCEEHGAELMLLSTPSTVNWDFQRHNGIKKLSEDLKIDYLDINLMKDQVPINWQNDTRDGGDHLNYFGAKKVSAFLGKYLSETEFIGSHRNDYNYRHWDEALKDFNASVSSSNN